MKKITLLIALTYATFIQAFTYQGELSQTGTLVNGTADFIFALYDAETKGNPVGMDDIHSGVTVENGRFIVNLEQWTAYYDGTPLWLEIEVDIGGTGTFVTLNPRQKLEPAVYAEFAYDSLAAGGGDITGVVAGTGLTGGGDSGTVTLNVDDTIFQRRVSTWCPTGKYIYKIEESGIAACREDISVDVTTLWSTNGNSGTDSSVNFIGTTDSESFIIKANNETAIRIIPQSESPNIVMGSSANNVTNYGGSVLGGGNAGSGCGISGTETCANRSLAIYSSVGGGKANSAYSAYSVISGGNGNHIYGVGTTIAGGRYNEARGAFSYVSAGYNNKANGDHSWAGGHTANVEDGHDGTFVWDGDADYFSLYSSTPGQFLARSPGGIWFGTQTGESTPDTSLAAVTIDAIAGEDAFLANVDGNAKLKVQSNGGLSVGADLATGNDGLRVAGETNLMGRVGVKELAPNATVHVDSPVGDVAFRVQVDGNTKLRVDSNGAVAIGSNFAGATLPANGLKVQGDADIVGSLSKGGGSFKIDHPIDPENKYLYHSFVESPDMMNIYNGNVTTDINGESWVEMPDWFEALNMEFRYQLTVIGVFAQAIVAEKMSNNRFMIKTNMPDVEVSWQVTGVRHDAWAEKNRIPVEKDKEGFEKGRYLHAEAWNAPEEKSMSYSGEEE